MNDIFFRENIFEILDYMDEGIHIVDSKGRTVYYNRAAQSLDDIDREKVIGRHILEIYPSLSHDTSTLLRSIQTGKTILNVEQTFINYKGDKITTLNSSIPIKAGGKIKGAIEISKDITQVRLLSEKIVELQKELYVTDKKPKKKKEKKNTNYTFVDIVGQTDEMIKLKSLGIRAAQTSSPVLIYGETGTGKELMVQSIHSASERKEKPFIAQNCAALPSSLLEGILFGTTKGGFTGAENRPGLFELADGGTLFLDEINSMPLELQAKLLRVLQDKRVRRVGGTNTIDVDVRIIAAMNTSPAEALESKQIRKDLYYRLNVIYFKIPTLKERKDDIPLFVDHFVDKYNKQFERDVKGVSKEVMEIFKNYSWSGNVRELQHVIEGMMSMHTEEIFEKEHLPPQFEEYVLKKNIKKDRIKPLKKSVEEFEAKIIKEALKTSDNNVSEAAKLMDIPRQTLQYKIKKYEIEMN